MGSEITFFGGIDEIGGSKILIKDNNQSLMFDFGISFSKLGHYFSDFLQPRSVNGIGDYLYFDIIPNIPNLYRKDLCKPVNFPSGDPPIDAIFISHAHTDHFGYVSFINEKVPVFGSEITNRIIDSYESIVRGGIDKEYINMKERPYGEHISPKKWIPLTRKFYDLKDYKGEVKIEFYPVDHSTWGAGMYQITTSDKLVVYTGDLRKHGTRGNLTEDSIKKLKKKQIDILIIEGTNVGQDFEKSEVNKLIKQIIGRESGEKIDSEDLLYTRILKEIGDTKKPIFFDFGMRDFDRLLTFYSIAQKIDRKLIIPIKLAKHIDDLKNDLKIDLNNSRIEIYLEPVKLGSFEFKEYNVWMRPYFEKYHATKPEEIKDNMNEYMIFMDYYHLKNLVDLGPSDGYYIHSSSEPFDEEAAIDFKRHLEWIKKFNLDYHYFHTSGHMSEEEIFSTIKELNPEKIIPIHTKGKEKFRLQFDNVIIPKTGIKM